MESVFTIGIMIFLAIAAFFSLSLPVKSIAGDVLAARGFPLIVIILSFFLCILLLVRQVKGKQRTHESLIDLRSPAGRAIVFTAIALAVYIALLNLIGFVISTLLFSVAAALLSGYRKAGKLAIFAVLVTVGLFLLFGKAFFVPLPRGIGIFRELSYLLY
jgi:hypothetical protein